VSYGGSTVFQKDKIEHDFTHGSSLCEDHLPFFLNRHNMVEPKILIEHLK